MEPHILQELIMTWLMPSFLSAVVAFLIGLIWYHPRVWAGNGWKPVRSLPMS